MAKYQVFVLIDTNMKDLRKISSQLLKFPQVENVHELYGEYDILIKIKGNSPQEVEEFMRDKIRSIPEIINTKTLVVSDVPL